jgi:hypothetical protein
MANNIIGCSTAKTTLIDPNAFDGQDSSTNISVPLEDLTISVELNTRKRARTILTTTQTAGSTSDSQGGVKVNFIGGEKQNNSRVLTTSYTDLTTTFNDENVSQNLGITNIDIDFNSSYAPMITINFIDVKGSAIFQNEEKIGDNKYSVFFELPYPLYNLTIKGYYGQPVSYCLHMTKYTSRFNSQTGNFEITASFIGYTYAILSDMLLGFLKAIEYTDLGKSKYKELKILNPNLLTLDDLYKAVSEINDNVNKLVSTDIDSKELNVGVDRLQKLEDIKTEINNLSRELDYNKTLDFYEFIILAPKDVNENVVEIEKFKKNIEDIINNKYNPDNNFKLNSNDFTDLESNYYSGVTINLLKTNDIKLKTIFSKLINRSGGEVFDKTIRRLLEYVTTNERLTNPGLTDTTPFSVYDNRIAYDKINEAKNKIENQNQLLKKSLANTLRQQIRTDLGFDPTVRNIINVFTTAVEVFLHVLFEVSKKAGDPTTTTRIEELKKKFLQPDNYDYNSIKNTTFYPWPDYRKESDAEGLVEEYLGKYGVLETPTNVTELNFIDNLLQAFIIQAENQAKVDQLILEEQQNWIPVNPFDTRFYNDKFPYQRTEGIVLSEVKSLILIRAMIFMGLSNRILTDAEIQQMAEYEANGILADITSPNIIGPLLNFNTPQEFVKDLLDTKGTVNDIKNNVLKKETLSISGIDIVYYNYDYIINGKTKKALPISGDFSGEWNEDDFVNYAENGRVFLTNYQQTIPYSTTLNKTLYKPDDGGKYISFIDITEYGNNVKPLISLIPITENKINLEALSKDFDEIKVDEVGFNVFGGNYGIQEFTNLNYNNADLDGLPFRYIFYADTITDTFFDDGFNKTSSFANKRKAGIKSAFDVRPAAYPVVVDLNNIVYYTDWQPNTNKAVFGKIKNIYHQYVFPTDDYDNGATHENYGKFRNLAKKQLNGDETVTFPFINFTVYDNNVTISSNKAAPISLFGSRFYYEQKTDEARAFLFLHTLPWNGLVDGKIFDKSEILNTFAHRAGFVSAPYLWVAFIGGLLWRADNTNDPISFSNTTSFIPTFPNNLTINQYPTKTQYLKSKTDKYKVSMYFDNTSYEYEDLDDILLTLPDQAKNEFKTFFENFVSTDWPILKNQLELIDSGVDWVTAYNNAQVISAGLDYSDETNTIIKVVRTAPLKTIYNKTNNGTLNFDNYTVVSPIDVTSYKYNFHLELKDGAQAVSTLIGLINKEIIIANSTYKIWKSETPNNIKIMDEISVLETNMNLYLNKMYEILSPNKGVSSTTIKKQQEQAIFGTSDENIIKLMLYRTCKNIYDKWIGETNNSDEIIFRCGGRNYVDTELAKKRGESTPKLIDSFRFVTRSFRDVGDELAINPTPVIQYLRDNPNSSFYDTVTNLLSSNNFDFIPLPSFINYRDENQLSSVFKPFSNYDTDIPTAGPSFICVYLGQKSKHLDINKNSNDITYPNDGFDISCNGQTILGLPKDFNTQASDYEDPVTFFKVNFGQQNQNIFKDITLDQSEFGETAESLQIIDDISRKGAETNRTLAGQNLYNVYSVRSYKVEVEMLGDAMIQPMMYFQLNNIPMFHGAYMITHVKHNIKPNHMSTHFTGVRLRKPETQIFGVGDLFMSLLDSLESSDTNQTSQTGVVFGTSRSSPSGNFPPIVRTIIENGGLNGNVEQGNIKTKAVPKIAGIDNSKLNDKADNKLLEEAVDPLVKMLTDWVTWMKANGFTGSNGYYAGITSIFRDYNKQVQVKRERGAAAAAPETSPHGWAIAIDLQFKKKDGTIIRNKENTASSFDVKENPALKWMLDNSYIYGWVLPYGLRNKSELEEHWHFEYHGTAAKCLAQKNPTTYGYTAVIDKQQLAIVKNPKGKDGKEAVYTDCEYKYVKDSGDGTEKNTLITKPEQAANQVKTKNFLKNKGLTKEQAAGIMGNIQQESAFNTGALNKKDLNGYASFGLIQWNEKYYTRQEVGTALDQQLNFMVNMSTYKKFINLAEPKTSVEKAAYEFANLVEVCDKCNKGFQIYKSSYQYVRTKYANDFFSRFNDTKDKLYW